MGKVLVISGADFSENSIGDVVSVGGIPIVINQYNTENGKFQKVQNGSVSDDSLDNWRTSYYLSVEEGTTLSGISNVYDNGTFTTGLLVFYDSSKNFVSYDETFLEQIGTTIAGTSKGYFGIKVPTGAKYVRLSWEKSGSNNSMDYPNLYVH